jgi:hypothetical protein
MSKRDVYVVHYTAVVSGVAYYSIPEEEKLKHFLDGSADIEWNLDSVRNIEMGDAEFSYTDDEGDEPTVEVVETQPGDDIPF